MNLFQISRCCHHKCENKYLLIAFFAFEDNAVEPRHAFTSTTRPVIGSSGASGRFLDRLSYNFVTGVFNYVCKSFMYLSFVVGG